MRIVFLGTPEFALAPLEACLAFEGGEVAAVVTQPDRPVGRGHKLQMPPVKRLALERGLPVHQFERIRRQEGLDLLRALKPDLMVTAAFGQILSQKILDIPPLGVINVHASLLPAYRGSAPIQWAIYHGEERTGVSIMYTARGVDTGDVILRRELAIGPEETGGELTCRLSRLGAQALTEALGQIARGEAARQPQDEALASHYSMIEKADGLLNWTRSAAALHDQIRAFNPAPGCFTTCPDGVLKVWRSQRVDPPRAGAPGQVLLADPKAGLVVAAGAGALALTEIQGPGGKRMRAADYLRGHPMAEGTVLGAEHG